MRFALVGVLFAVAPSMLGMAWLLWNYASDPNRGGRNDFNPS